MQASSSFIVLRELAGHPAPYLDPLQQFLADHIQLATWFWLGIWCATGIVVLVHLWYEYREQYGK